MQKIKIYKIKYINFWKKFRLNYQITQKDQLEYCFNVLDNSEAIMKPPYSQIMKNLFIINTNIINYKIKNKIVLANDSIVRIYNSGEGNSFLKYLVNFL